MLVLSRKESESIILTDEASKREITIKLVAINGNRARIGIEADMQVKVLREELREAS
jgi:carbon storage regulator CsrA